MYSSLVFHSFQNLIIKPIHYRFYHWFHQSMAKIELNSVLIVEHRAFLLSMLQILPLILGEIVSRSEWDVCRRTVNRSEFPSIHYTMMSCHMQMWSRRMTSHDISHCCRAEWRYYNGFKSILMENSYIFKFTYIGHSLLDTPMLNSCILDTLSLDTPSFEIWDLKFEIWQYSI